MSVVQVHFWTKCKSFGVFWLATQVIHFFLFITWRSLNTPKAHGGACKTLYAMQRGMNEVNTDGSQQSHARSNALLHFGRTKGITQWYHFNIPRIEWNEQAKWFTSSLAILRKRHFSHLYNSEPSFTCILSCLVLVLMSVWLISEYNTLSAFVEPRWVNCYLSTWGKWAALVPRRRRVPKRRIALHNERVPFVLRLSPNTEASLSTTLGMLLVYPPLGSNDAKVKHSETLVLQEEKHRVTHTSPRSFKVSHCVPAASLHLTSRPTKPSQAALDPAHGQLVSQSCICSSSLDVRPALLHLAASEEAKQRWQANNQAGARQDKSNLWTECKAKLSQAREQEAVGELQAQMWTTSSKVSDLSCSLQI